MTVINRLACSLGRRDEVPNQELAQQILKSKNQRAVRELVENLANPDKNIQSDCIKVLYEIGERQTDLIAPYDKEFLALLESRNNRLVWGAMTALDCIAAVNPRGIFQSLSKIIAAADQGSVITKDHFVGILIKLAATKNYADTALSLLLDELKVCATNQLPMYAERSVGAITADYQSSFVKVLATRLVNVEKESQRRRIEKVMRKVGKAAARKV